MNYKLEKKIGTVKALVSYPKLMLQLAKLNTDHFFFFPSVQTGGGERVHADILHALAHLNPVCFISHRSPNNDMEPEFRASSTVVKLGRWGWKKSFMPIMLKKIAKAINRQKNPVVFGCDTHFFYNLIPYLDAKVKVIDLVHNFTADDWSAGNYSINLAERIHARVVLGEQNYLRFEELYRRHQKDVKLMDRVRIIHNQVKVPQTYPNKDYKGLLHVVFVARNCSDKRPKVFLDIAKACRERHLPLRFTMVGDFSAYMEQDTREVAMPGRITDKDELNDIYDSAHLILCTSRTEGFPMVFLEGMSRGVVPVSTDVGEVKNYISVGRGTGFVLDNHEEDRQIVLDFVEVLTQICDNTKLLEHYARNGYELVREHFSEASFIENYRNLITLKELTPARRPQPEDLINIKRQREMVSL